MPNETAIRWPTSESLLRDDQGRSSPVDSHRSRKKFILGVGPASRSLSSEHAFNSTAVRMGPKATFTKRKAKEVIMNTTAARQAAETTAANPKVLGGGGALSERQRRQRGRVLQAGLRRRRGRSQIHAGPSADPLPPLHQRRIGDAERSFPGVRPPAEGAAGLQPAPGGR